MMMVEGEEGLRRYLSGLRSRSLSWTMRLGMGVVLVSERKMKRKIGQSDEAEMWYT